MASHDIPQVAVFDVYDTLTHWRHTVEEMAAEIGKTAAIILQGSADLAEAADLGEITYEEYGRKMTERWGVPRYAERVMAGLTPIEEVHELALDFHAAGSQLVIASNVGQGALRLSFEGGALPPPTHFLHVVQSCRLGVAKPNQEFYARIMELTGASPADHLFHDDNVANIAAAQTAGMQTAHIDPANILASVTEIRERYGLDTAAAYPISV